MSGFEVAGLVLAVIPIVVSALQQYSDTKQLVRDIRTRKRVQHLQLLIATLEETRFIINTSLVRVSLAAGVSSAPLASKAGPGTALDQHILTDEQACGEIREYLGDERYSFLLRRLGFCQDMLYDVIKSIDGLVPSKPPSTTSAPDLFKDLLQINKMSAAETLWKGSVKDLKFFMKKDELNESMSVLKDSTERLKELCMPSPFEVQTRNDENGLSWGSVNGLAKVFTRVQDKASQLYSALASTMPVTCHSSHRTRLYLDERAGIMKKKKLGRLSFDVGVAGLTESGDIDVWHQCPVHLTETSDGYLPNSSSKVKVDIPSERWKKDFTAVGLFCHCVGGASLSQPTVELHLLDDGKLHYIRITGPTSAPTLARGSSPLDSYSTAYISMAQVLELAQKPRTLERRWTHNQRAVLAFGLACSLIQLKRTPWLYGSFRSKNISFPTTISNDPPGFETSKPFLTRTASPNFAVTEGNTAINGGTEEPEPNQLMLDLAILLLEIHSKRGIAHWADEAGLDYDESSHDSRFNAARTWIEEVYEDMPELYGKATTTCIGNASVNVARWEDEDFQKLYIEGVVQRLWQNCRHILP